MTAFLDSAVPPARMAPGPLQSTPVNTRFRGPSRRLRIGLVNNMPDAALAATERQFVSLVQGTSPYPVDFHLFHIEKITRSAEATALLKARYRPVEQLFGSSIDGLIVTGNEPRAARIDQEPYWSDLKAVVDWAREHTRTTIWSCLAAHAAVLHLDGIERRRLPEKKSGVLSSKVNSFLSGILPPTLSVCHSRLNEVRKDHLTDNGYEIVSEAAGNHVDIFSKRVGSRFVFLQGHPEYEPDSLMREYRRDVGRYINGLRDSYPEVPENYFDDLTVLRLDNYRARIERTPDRRLFADFPDVTLRRGLELSLAQSASSVFSHWLSHMDVMPV